MADIPADIPQGVIQGGWPFIWAAFGVTFGILGAYALQLKSRLRRAEKDLDPPNTSALSAANDKGAP